MRHNIDSFDSSVNQGTKFLTEYFHKGVNYSMVNTVRSALPSATILTKIYERNFRVSMK